MVKATRFKGVIDASLEGGSVLISIESDPMGVIKDMADMLKLSLEIKIQMLGYIPSLPHALANALTQEGWQVLKLKTTKGKDPGDVVY